MSQENSINEVTETEVTEATTAPIAEIPQEQQPEQDQKQEQEQDVITIDKNEVVYIKKTELQVSKDNPRKDFRDQNINKLRDDIYANGILTPLVVYKKKEEDTKYIIADGECRFRACKQIPEIEELPCVVVDAQKGKEWTAKSVFMREDLNAIEKSNALWNYIKIMDPNAGFSEKGRFQSSMTAKAYRDKLGIRLGSTFTELLSFSKLPDDIRKEQEKTGLIPQRDLRVLCRGACAKDEATMRDRYAKLKEHCKRLEEEQKAQAKKKDKSAPNLRKELVIQGVRNKIIFTKDYYDGVSFEKLDDTQKLKMKEAYEQVLADIESLKEICSKKIADLENLINNPTQPAAESENK